MEKAKSELLELLNSPDFYKDHDHVRMTTANTKLEEVEADLTLAYSRWDELEELVTSLGNRS